MRRINRKSIRIEILALLALVCQRRRDEAVALQYLQNALELAEPGGWIRTFVDMGAPMARLLECFIEHHPPETFARQVHDACLMPTREPVPLETDRNARPSIRGKANGYSLTPRETEILSLIAEGMSNKEMAEKLFVSPSTIKTHTKNIFKKLGVRRRMEAVNKVFGSRQLTRN